MGSKYKWEILGYTIEYTPKVYFRIMKICHDKVVGAYTKILYEKWYNQK